MLGSGNYLSFLGDAILEWAEEHSYPAEHEDVVRSFFKHHVSFEATFQVCVPEFCICSCRHFPMFYTELETCSSSVRKSAPRLLFCQNGS